MRAHGKRPRIWNDGLHTGEGTITPDLDIVIDFWSRAGIPQLPLPFFGIARTAPDLIAAGHQVKNAAFTPNYYVTGGPAVIGNIPAPLAYELWDPTLFVDGTRLTPEQNASSLGSGLYVWCDDPIAQTPAQLATSITMPLRVMAQKTWGPAIPATYLEFPLGRGRRTRLDRAEDLSAAEGSLQWHFEGAENRDHGAHSADGIGARTRSKFHGDRQIGLGHAGIHAVALRRSGLEVDRDPIIGDP
ncbi:hypothetical protein AB0E01_04525 [Nocardia vinacea]|uniref:hypothetical protein n=1 Tax=Nocardia vinacea TaxID=96468 RepID=UPI0034053EE9